MASVYPVTVMWNFGYQCNMNCIHCYSRQDARANIEHEMTLVQAEHIAAEIIAAKAVHTHFGGGESLMRPDFGPIASSLTSTGINVSLSSNGAFIDESTANLLRVIPLDFVSLSFHGIKAATHDAFTRHPGSFDGLLRAATILKAAGVRTKIVFSLHARSRDEAPGVFDLARECGVTFVQFAYVKAVGNAAENLTSLQLSPSEWVALYSAIRTQAESYPDLNIHFGLDNNPIIAGYVGQTILPCPCGRYSIAIKPNGDVSPCNVVTTVVGNVYRQSLLDIWQEAPELIKIRSGTANPCASF